MRRGVALLLLALAGCRGEPPSILNEAELASPSDDLNALLADLPPAPESQQQLAPAAVQARVAQHLRGRRVLEARAGRANAVCGRVQERGGPRPFVLRADDRLVVGTRAEISYGDPLDPFPDIYLEFCATPEELQQVRSAPLPPPPPELIAPPADTAPPEPDAPAEPAPEVRARDVRPPAAPAPGTGEPPPDTDFFNAVRRPDRGA